jgi:membrane protein required for colicin V production
VNGFDMFVLVLGLVLVLLGLFRGLVRMAVGLGGLVLGIFLAIRFEERATPLVRRVVDSELWGSMIAFVGIVVGVVLAAAVVSFVLRKLLKAANLAWVDRGLGAAVGLVGALFLSAALSIILTAGLPRDSRLLADSKLAPITLRLSVALVRLAPPSLRQRFDAGMQRLRVIR